MDTSVVAGDRSVAKRRYRSAAEKVQIVAESREAGASVAQVARCHDMNANQLFSWRRLDEQGLLARQRQRQARLSTPMNGRVYDPLIGRFVSADPFIQFPDNTQSFNRYSYVLNNPLSFTDPSGYSIGSFIKKWWRPIVAIVAAVVTYGAASGWMAASAGNTAFAGAMCGYR